MFIELPPKKCKKCGSIRNEIFIQGMVQGIRCLNCGHEVIQAETSSAGENKVWIHAPTQADNYF